MISRKSKHEFVVRVPMNADPVTVEDVHDMRAWCTQMLGDGGRNPKCHWRYGWLDRYYDTFYFKKERDALMFVLRWS